jgi:hypothetical protein
MCGSVQPDPMTAFQSSVGNANAAPIAAECRRSVAALGTFCTFDLLIHFKLCTFHFPLEV